MAVLFKDTKIFNTLLSRCTNGGLMMTDERIPEGLRKFMEVFEYDGDRYDSNIFDPDFDSGFLEESRMTLPEEPVLSPKPVTSTVYFDKSDTHGGPDQKKLL